ncbi:MAG: hypothetical protein ACR2H2_17720 [Solirubrobacteraceae bacterium]
MFREYRETSGTGAWHTCGHGTSWDPIRKNVGLNGMDVYELRHYCATILLDNGAMPEDIALQFGHSDFGDLIRKLYGHPNDELQLERLEHVMRNRTIPITVRVTPEPPTDLDDEQLAA